MDSEATSGLESRGWGGVANHPDDFSLNPIRKGKRSEQSPVPYVMSADMWTGFQLWTIEDGLG